MKIKINEDLLFGLLFFTGVMLIVFIISMSK